jgi:hypothetical protein
MLASSVMTAAAVVLFTLGVAVSCNAVFADEPLTGVECSGCSCGEEYAACLQNTDRDLTCSWDTYTCTCVEIFENDCET